MKVISTGRRFEDDEEAWAGLRIECENCRCTFELEYDDAVMVKREGPFTHLGMFCPECHNGIAVTGPSHYFDQRAHQRHRARALIEP